MFRGILFHDFRNLKNIVPVRQMVRTVINQGAMGPSYCPKIPVSLLLANPQSVLTNIYTKTIRNYKTSASLSFYNSPGLKSDPCKGNNAPQQEEEEGCTITPCCRPFRLQKEHPMKNVKKPPADACEKKEDKKPPPKK